MDRLLAEITQSGHVAYAIARGTHRVFFRDMEIGELNVEELRFRAARQWSESADEGIWPIALNRRSRLDRSADTGRLFRNLSSSWIDRQV